MYRFPVVILLLFITQHLAAQSSMTNIPGRHRISLNGKWNTVTDPYNNGSGEWTAYYKDKKPVKNTDFVEYSFDDGPRWDVPGDFNTYLGAYESAVWYKKKITYDTTGNKRTFIHFGAVNYKAEIYLNNIKIGDHEGGFTPFQIECTGKMQQGENSLIVKANNARLKDGIPGLNFDWFNYGGITRDVDLIETPDTYIKDYFIQLKKNNPAVIEGAVQLDGPVKQQQVKIEIMNKIVTCHTDNTGQAHFEMPFSLQRWSPENPKRYEVKISSQSDTLKELIGFRNIQVKGTAILLNGKPIFLKGVNIHEEIPQKRARATSEDDARMLLGWAKELGCNFVRLAHYPHNEHMVRLAEEMGLLVWEEIPIYQGIDFEDPGMKIKMETMLEEMIQRDKNRCAIIIWSLSNETAQSLSRNNTLASLAQKARSLDSTRLITSAMNTMRFSHDSVIINDVANNNFDILAINEYLGWYKPWPALPASMKWVSVFNKPLIISEFGAEALYGNTEGEKDKAYTWSEEYQEQVFTDQINMFKTIPFLCGVSPWVLADYRSPSRNHPKYQNGWNRKGLVSDGGNRKKAWYIMHDFYSTTTSPH